MQLTIMNKSRLTIHSWDSAEVWRLVPMGCSSHSSASCLHWFWGKGGSTVWRGVASTPDSVGRRNGALSRIWGPARGRSGLQINKDLQESEGTMGVMQKRNYTCRLCGREVNWALQCWISPRASSWALGFSAQERDTEEVKRSRVFRLQSAGYCVQTGGAMEAGAIELGLWKDKQTINNPFFSQMNSEKSKEASVCAHI